MDPTSIPSLATVTSFVTTGDERNNNVAVARRTPNHPTYKEMIHNAIATLKKRNGSSKRAIAKHIEQTFTHLPSTHSALLTLHLKRLKSKGVLVMVKKSYKLARSDASSRSTQPKRGRPCKPKPKPKPEQPQLVEARNNVKQMWVALGLEDEPANSEVKKRGPGRPPKERAVEVSEPRIRRSIRLKTRPERHPKPKSVSKIPNGPKRGVGRPSKTQSNVPVMPIESLRGRGRAKSTSLCEQGTSDSDDLRKKLWNFQSKVRESLVPIKGIIQELEMLASMDLN